MNKIYTSKADINHNNNTAILTIFTYNREKISLLNKIKILNNKNIVPYWSRTNKLMFRRHLL